MLARRLVGLLDFSATLAWPVKWGVTQSRRVTDRLHLDMSTIDYLWYMLTIDYMRPLVRVRSPAELGALIRARRRELGLDQSALADKVGVSRQWIIEIEKGKPRAAIGLVLRTLSALDVLLDARNEPPQRAKLSGTQVDLDALISAARKPRS